MADKATSQRSQYRFPYHRLDTCVDTAKVIEQQGSGRMRPQDLARNLNLSATSSSFEMRLVSARLFGLIRRAGDVFEATALAKRVLGGAGQARAQALAEAFKTVPLFKAALGRFDGTPLPIEDRDLEALLEGDLGVKPGDGGRARRLLIASAEVAGLLQVGDGKRWLVSSPVQETQGTGVTPDGGAPVVPQPGGGGTPSPPTDPPPSSPLGWPPIDPQALADWEPEKLKIYMDGLERIARALRGEPPATTEEDSAE
ncbi:MAG TPA: hypothetical protein VM537_26615 [Anaerolineae bacterium]|nr:hypothetical protein [Anaerolineae bacterium]